MKSLVDDFDKHIFPSPSHVIPMMSEAKRRNLALLGENSGRNPALRINSIMGFLVGCLRDLFEMTRPARSPTFCKIT